MATRETELRSGERRTASASRDAGAPHQKGGPGGRLALMIGGGALAVLGGGLVYWGVTRKANGYAAADLGHAHDSTGHVGHLGIMVERGIAIDRPLEEIYSFWRNFENLAKFMSHVESVQVLDDSRSHWIVTGPAGTTVEWDAVIHNEVPGELIAWKSIGVADVDSAGAVNFRRAPGGRGTEVRVKLQYDPPAGVVGAAVAKLFGEDPATQIEEDLKRLKMLLEAGETPTTEGQPSGRTA